MKNWRICSFLYLQPPDGMIERQLGGDSSLAQLMSRLIFNKRERKKEFLDEVDSIIVI
jgi:hypothetical protein